MSFKDKLKALARREKEAKDEGTRRWEERRKQEEANRRRIAALERGSSRLLVPILNEVITHYLADEKDARVSLEYVGRETISVSLRWGYREEVDSRDDRGRREIYASEISLRHDHGSQSVVVDGLTLSLEDKSWKESVESTILTILERGVGTVLIN